MRLEDFARGAQSLAVKATSCWHGVVSCHNNKIASRAARTVAEAWQERAESLVVRVGWRGGAISPSLESPRGSPPASLRTSHTMVSLCIIPPAGTERHPSRLVAPNPPESRPGSPFPRAKRKSIGCSRTGSKPDHLVLVLQVRVGIGALLAWGSCSMVHGLHATPNLCRGLLSRSKFKPAARVIMLSIVERIDSLCAVALHPGECPPLSC